MKAERESRVFIVLLNWNGWRDTVECLSTLLPCISMETRVVICDNASTDNSISEMTDWIVEHYPMMRPVLLKRAAVFAGAAPDGGRVFIIDNAANLGFAAGNNSGIRLAMNDPACRYVWLLNNDTTVDAESLTAAITRMESDPSIGICGSTLVYFHEQDKVQAFGGAVYSRWTGRSRHVGAFARRSDIPVDPSAVESQMSYVVGAAMLVSRAFIEQVGYMREDYFLYCEEIDWASRGRGRFRLGYAPRSVVLHKEGASIGTSASGGSPLSLFYLFRNRIRYACRFTPLFVPSVLFFCAVDVAKLGIKRRWPQAKAAIRGILQLEPPRPIARAS